MKKVIYIVFLFLIASMAFITPFSSADASTLVNDDFQQDSFQKTVDYFDYARVYATLQGISVPDDFDQWHANMYITYVNTSGVQLLYAGLENITTDESGYLRIPTQTIFMHYKTNVENQHVVTALSFLMLMAFNDSSTSRFEGSPDVGDNLFASYSLGFDFSSIGANRPILNSKTEIIPLVKSSDGLHWSWGMKYTNLTALWWKTWLEPGNTQFGNSPPFAITTYDELTFKYTLTIDPTNGKAILTENHYIGRMRDMLIGAGLFWLHLNSTGTYGLLGGKLSDQTIYSFLDSNKISMSIVDYQTTVIANQTIYNTTPGGEVLDTEKIVTNSAIDTYADDGNKISSLDFSAKRAYYLYNYTQDPTESTKQTYNAVTRTADATALTGDGGIFKVQINLMKFLPLVIMHMYPGLYQKASESISDMTKANYFYITSYPTYSGYKIEHDPVFTAYIAKTPAATTISEDNQRTGILLAVIVAIIIAAIIATVLAISRKSKNKIPPPPPL